jgi:hypothetical protein
MATSGGPICTRHIGRFWARACADGKGYMGYPGSGLLKSSVRCKKVGAFVHCQVKIILDTCIAQIEAGKAHREESELANGMNTKSYPVRVGILLKGIESSKTLLESLAGVLVRISRYESLFRVFTPNLTLRSSVVQTTCASKVSSSRNDTMALTRTLEQCHAITKGLGGTCTQRKT